MNWIGGTSVRRGKKGLQFWAYSFDVDIRIWFGLISGYVFVLIVLIFAWAVLLGKIIFQYGLNNSALWSKQYCIIV